MNLNHVEVSAQALEDDVVAWVKAHPTYVHIVETLGAQAIEALAKSAGL